MRAALDLAMFFKCSPYEFLDRSRDEILNLHRATIVRLRERRLSA